MFIRFLNVNKMLTSEIMISFILSTFVNVKMPIRRDHISHECKQNIACVWERYDEE